jgi:hypothetical protein
VTYHEASEPPQRLFQDSGLDRSRSDYLQAYPVGELWGSVDRWHRSVEMSGLSGWLVFLLGFCLWLESEALDAVGGTGGTGKTEAIWMGHREQK